MKQQLLIAIRMTIVTTVLLGLAYPLVVTGLAQWLFPAKADGQLIRRDGVVIGSRIIGQPFAADKYFHGRPSAAGTNGYDAGNSSGSNLGPTNRQLIERVRADAARLAAENPGRPVPVDLVTTSGSGLDPDISLAGALFQVPRVARARGVSEGEVERIVRTHTNTPLLGLIGERTVNVLELNLDLDSRWPATQPLAGPSSK
jgi:potassium-transporting ATPase KdpC subunit